jgi:hypothetical protein
MGGEGRGQAGIKMQESGQPTASGSLAFYRKLSRITATQQLFLCQLNFNGDTSGRALIRFNLG